MTHDIKSSGKLVVQRGPVLDPGGSWFRQDKSADTQDCLSDG